VWKLILKEFSGRKFYPDGFLDKVKAEGLEKELIEVENRYKETGEIYGRNWWIVEIIEDGMLDNHSVQKIIQTLHRYIDNDTNEDQRLSQAVEEEMGRMPELRMVPKPSKEWDEIKERLMREKKRGR